MQASATKIARAPSRPNVSSAIEIPEQSTDLLAAKRAIDDIAAALVVARADTERLSAYFNMFPLQRSDGSLFPDTGREGALAKLMGQCADLERSQGKAQRDFNDARQAFSEQVSRDITPAADDISEKALAHVEEAMRLVELLSDVAIEARRSGITLRHAQINRAGNLASQLYSLRAALAPTPTMGVRQ